MISISDRNLNLINIKSELYKQRLNNEINYLNSLEITEDNNKRKDYLKSVLDSTEINTAAKKDEMINDEMRQISEKEFKKCWVRMAIPYKIIKVEEYCKEKDIDDETKNKYIEMVKEKKLKTKNVEYDNKICKIKKIQV